MHADAGPPRGIRIRDPARPVGTFRRATLADATAKADHPAIAQTEAAIAVIAAVAIRAVAVVAITAEADREVARAAPAQAAVVAMGTAGGMAAAETAGANADTPGRCYFRTTSHSRTQAIRNFGSSDCSVVAQLKQHTVNGRGAVVPRIATDALA
jgi:hypothetical protein